MPSRPQHGDCRGWCQLWGAVLYSLPPSLAMSFLKLPLISFWISCQTKDGFAMFRLHGNLLWCSANLHRQGNPFEYSWQLSCGPHLSEVAHGRVSTGVILAAAWHRNLAPRKMASKGKWDRTNRKKNGEIMVVLGEIIGIYMEIMIGHSYLCVRVWRWSAYHPHSNFMRETAIN